MKILKIFLYNVAQMSEKPMVFSPRPSRGSVIPLFVKQIKNNEEITITDPYMTRFLMSLEDSVNLMLLR